MKKSELPVRYKLPFQVLLVWYRQLRTGLLSQSS